MKRRAGMICMILGAVLIGAALSLFLYNEWDSARAEERAEQVLEQIYTSMKLGARACHKLLKVARTIADLAGSEIVRKEDLLEAACYCQGQE